jgi:hypothetical protein
MNALLPVFAALSILSHAREIALPAGKATDFIRVERTEKEVLLQPAAATYERDGVKVTLLGAVHIADTAYFNDLNKRFKSYDRILFEMIGGDKLAGIRKKEEEGEKVETSPLAKIYGMISNFLELADQKSEIDYSAKNFVHADLTMAEYQKLQEERGESLLGFAMDAAKNADPANEPSTLSLMTALLSGNSDQAKLLLIEALAGGDEAMAGLVNPSVIITDRNAKALEVLDAQIKAGHKNLGIFYGVAHFPDMEKSFLKKGYKKTKQEWLTAWSVAKE